MASAGSLHNDPLALGSRVTCSTNDPGSAQSPIALLVCVLLVKCTGSSVRFP